MTSDLLRLPARYLFFGALACAPWFYGGTTVISIVVINWLLGAAILLWIVELIITRRRPKFPKLLLLLVGTLLAVGLWMTINAHAIYDENFGRFAIISNLAPWAPGSFDYPISAAWMIRCALLLLSILFVVDLSRNDKYLLQLWQIISIVAGSICLLGLLQKATGAGAIFWQTPPAGYGKTFFATYYYHANAGAFLNLALPFTAGMTVRAFSTPTGPGMRSLWLMTCLLNLAAIASNTSRGAQLVGGLIVIALIWVLGPRVFRGLSRSEKNATLGGAVAVLLVLYAIGQASHLEQPLARWKQSEEISADARWQASHVAITALPGIGLFGLGPGTFRAVFPSYNRAVNYLVAGEWRFLHEDYLQTLMEWGWIGAPLWALLFFGGMANAVFCLRRQTVFRRGAARKTEKLKTEKLKSENSPQVLASQSLSISAFSQHWSRRRRLILPLTIIALAGVAVHALVDFPFQIMSIQLYAATCLGLCWGSAAWKS